MPKSLFIVESPAKAKTLSRYLGKDFVVQATVGHIKDLPDSNLGVNVEKDFAPSYRIIRGKAKVVEGIREAALTVDSVYLASDPDREGEAIAWHVAQEISKGRKKEDLPKFYRVLLHEITKAGLQRALSEAGELDRKRYESQLSRRILDRLVGYELSPLLWKKVSGGLSAGRVQSVAVALVVDRERQIHAFDSDEYWLVRAALEGKTPPPFEARLTHIKKDKAVVGSEGQVKPLLETLRKADWVVKAVSRDEKRRFAPPPFITSTLQQEAHRLYRFTAKKTMSLAQRLYEGTDLGDRGTHGLITYMRTDSTRTAGEALGAARNYIEKEFGKDYLPAKPLSYKNKRSAQDAHEAIRPTSMQFTPPSVAQFLDRDLQRLYALIWNRFLASQMMPARFDVTVATILAGTDHTFEATGRVMLFNGYLKLYREAEPDDDDSGQLPVLTAGEAVKLVDVTGEQHFTQPPPRFTEGTLVKELEKRGIGRPSTYASILSTIQEKQYVERLKGKFGPTELGYVVTDLLRDNFPDIMDAKFTAGMELELDKVEEGAVKRPELLSTFWSKFSGSLDEAKVQMKSVKKDPEKTEIECPRCSNAMVIRFGKNGAFLACSRFPECKSTLAFKRDEKGKPEVVKAEIADEKCVQCSSDMILKEGRYGRFWACSNYPTCKSTLPFSTGLTCPREKCEGTLLEKRSKKNSTYYRCSKAPECDFVAFGKLNPTPCSSCDNSYLEEKGRGKKKTLTCPKCGTKANS